MGGAPLGATLGSQLCAWTQAAVGDSVVGRRVVGASLGAGVVGTWEGYGTGKADGDGKGTRVGAGCGARLGWPGITVGRGVVGSGLGATEGSSVGAGTGNCVGAAVGVGVGTDVGWMPTANDIVKRAGEPASRVAYSESASVSSLVSVCGCGGSQLARGGVHWTYL